MSKSNKYIVIILIILVIILFAPTIIFYNDIKFDKILFVNNWLTSIGQGLVIAVLFQLILTSHLRAIHKEEDYNIISNIIVTLNDIIAIINGNSNIDIVDIKNKLNNIENMHLLMHSERTKNKINDIMKKKDYVKFKELIVSVEHYNDSRYIIRLLNLTIEDIKQVLNNY